MIFITKHFGRIALSQAERTKGRNGVSYVQFFFLLLNKIKLQQLVYVFWVALFTTETLLVHHPIEYTVVVVVVVVVVCTR